MNSDPIADMLTRIRNGYLAKKRQVDIPWSKMKKAIGEILVRQGYIKSIKVPARLNARSPQATELLAGQSIKDKKLIIELKYENKKPAISKIKRISKPGRRVYVRCDKIPYVLSGFGECLISTSKGIITGKEARKKRLGGEIICEVW